VRVLRSIPLLDAAAMEAVRKWRYSPLLLNGEAERFVRRGACDCISKMKRIHVIGDDNAISSQARAYAEYRVFSALTRHALKFRSARVLLRPNEDRGTCDKVFCALLVALEPSGSVRVRVTGPHVYAAINRAVERLCDVLGGRIEQRRSS
jgi:ribosome-associated translation inhibitor RaiA